MKRVFLHLGCVFLLLFSQQIALAHLASHIHGETPAHQDSKEKASFQAGLCGFHGAFAQMLGGVQTAPLIHAVPHCVAEHLAHQSVPRRTVESLTPPSRAPPVPL